MIHCSKCKAENEPQRDTCHKCKANLLPDEGMFGETPLYKRYAKRARRHIILDVQQALADFTKALELVPHTERTSLLKERAALYRELEMREELKQDWEEILTLVPQTERTPLLEERAAIYEQLEMNQELSVDLEEILSHLLTDLEWTSGSEKQNIAIKLASIYMSLESVYRKLGLEKEAIRTHLDWTYFAEDNRHDLFTGKGPGEIGALAVQLMGMNSKAFSKAVAHDQVELMVQDFRNERWKMVNAGQVKAIGYCPKCEQVLVLDSYCQCTLCLNRISPEGRYLMQEEVNTAVEAMRRRLHLPMGSAQPTFSTATRMRIREIVKSYSPMITDEHFFFQANIPPKQLTNALGAYAKDVMPEDVLVLVDDTAFGSAKEGAILTETHLYAHGVMQTPVSIELGAIEEVSCKKSESTTGPMLLVNGLPFLQTKAPSKEAMQRFTLMLKEIVTTFQPQANAAASKDTTQLKAIGLFTSPQGTSKLGIREIVARYDPMIIDEHFFFRPDIPQKKLLNALGVYAKDVVPEDVLILVDESGNAKDGALLTETHLYAHSGMQKPVSIKLGSIEDVSFFRGWSGAPTGLLVKGLPFLNLSLPEKLATYLFTLMLKEIVTTFQPQGKTAALMDTTALAADGQLTIPQETSRMGIKEIMSRYCILVFDQCFFFQPHIPEKKLLNALGAYAKDVMPMDVLALVDDSGNAKDGAVLTETHLYAHSATSKPVSIRLSSIEDVAFRKGESGSLPGLFVNGMPFLKLSLPDKQAIHLFALMLKEIVSTFQPQANVAAPMGITQLKTDGQPTIPQETSKTGIREIVTRYSAMITDTRFLFQPNIPSKKLTNALRAYAKDAMPEDVLVLVDNAPFGSAKDGAMLTETHLYAHNMMQEPVSIKLSSIEKVSFKEGTDKPPSSPELLVNGSPFVGLVFPSEGGTRLFARMLTEIVTTFQPQANAATPVEAPPSQNLV